MKDRVKMDVALLLVIITASVLMYFCRNLYPANRAVDHMFDFLGVIIILQGTFLRMAARGHKQTNSQKGASVVMTGPYTIARNPMYLGSMMIGCGFVLIVWPWWFVVIFCGIFYARFNIQIIKEEEWLSKNFKDSFNAYTQSVPRLFPSISKLMHANLKEAFPLSEAFSTKEKYGMIGWPLLGLIVGLIQQAVIYQSLDLGRSFLAFGLAVIVFLLRLVMVYKT